MKDAAERYSPEIAEAFHPTETERPATKKSCAVFDLRADQKPIHTVAATVARLNVSIQGWMCIDELNRAFAGQPPSGFVPPPHLFIASNLDRDGGPNNFYEPENGYKGIYKTIWGK